MVVEILVQKAEFGHTKQKVTRNSTQAYTSNHSIRSGIISGRFITANVSSTLPSLFPQGRDPTQHFGLISPRRCCSVSLPASFGSAWCLPGPLTVGCHNDIGQRREAWRSSGLARWRGGGRTEI